MAGSYGHVTKDDGTFICEDFCNMIENLGDAHEACEMMHFMINYLANELNRRGPRFKSEYLEEAEKAYYEFSRRTGACKWQTFKQIS